MFFGITTLDHVQITVGTMEIDETIRFYTDILGLRQIAKPEPLVRNGGAWFRIDDGGELHVSVESSATAEANRASRRHVCFTVTDLDAAMAAAESAGQSVIADRQPIAGWRRFYLRDPGGNRIEIAQKTGSPT